MNCVRLFPYCLVLSLLVNAAVSLDCPALPPHTPASILDLRANNIKVVMAVGESNVAGYGIVDGDEQRGASFAVGGDSNSTTLPNFFKQFVPSLSGAAKGSRQPEICNSEKCPQFSYDPSVDGLNAAHSGAGLFDIMGNEVDYLIDQINASKDIDVANDWKVLTMYVGVDDMCAAICQPKDYYATGLDQIEWENSMIDILERVRENIPRTFVNLVPSLKFNSVFNYAKSLTGCSRNKPSYISCGCIFDSSDSAIRDKLDTFANAQIDSMDAIVEFYRESNFEDFAVALHSFTLADLTPSVTGLDVESSLLSPVDCFHLGQHGHEAFAVALWNSMFTHPDSKKKFIDEDDTPICPTEDTPIYAF